MPPSKLKITKNRPQFARLKTRAELKEFFNTVREPLENLDAKLPEWKSLEKFALDHVQSGRIYELGWSSDAAKRRLPLIGMSFGSEDPKAPTLVLVGGIHGLERIGSQVTLAILSQLGELMLWDKLIGQALNQIRIVAVPIANPLGIFHRTRANPHGVDLMRNSPVNASDKPLPLLGGHRLSPKIPWYRGLHADQLEPENEALVQFCRHEFFSSSAAISIDFHSGFGTRDQIWFPFAGDRKPFPQLAEFHALSDLFRLAHPNHIYKIEPQSKVYLTHGDLWDHIYNLFAGQLRKGTPSKTTSPDSLNQQVYLPLTLEMGSWLWLKKNPMQIFNPLGAFHPMKPHRVQRILRRHWPLIDFMIRSLVTSEAWSTPSPRQRKIHHQRAHALWYAE